MLTKENLCGIIATNQKAQLSYIMLNHFKWKIKNEIQTSFPKSKSVFRFSINDFELENQKRNSNLWSAYE